MKFKINGVDILPYLKEKGIKREEFDLEAPNAGRTTMDGKMHRAVVAKKLKYTLTFLPLSERDANIVLNLVSTPFFSVETTDLRRGDVTLTMYANNIPSQITQIQDNGLTRWDGLVIPLIEQ